MSVFINFIFMPLIALVALIYAVNSYNVSKEAIRDPSQIKGICKIQKLGKLVQLKGQISNNDTIHATNFLVKGKASGKVYAFKAYAPSDEVKKTDYESDGSVVLSLDRLTTKSFCNFEIIAGKNFHIEPLLRAVWGRGSHSVINISPDTPEITKHLTYEWGELSNNARQKWIKNNSVN